MDEAVETAIRELMCNQCRFFTDSPCEVCERCEVEALLGEMEEKHE